MMCRAAWRDQRIHVEDELSTYAAKVFRMILEKGFNMNFQLEEIIFLECIPRYLCVMYGG